LSFVSCEGIDHCWPMPSVLVKHSCSHLFVAISASLYVNLRVRLMSIHVATAGINPDTDDDASDDTGVEIGAPTHAHPPQSHGSVTARRRSPHPLTLALTFTLMCTLARKRSRAQTLQLTRTLRQALALVLTLVPVLATILTLTLTLTRMLALALTLEPPSHCPGNPRQRISPLWQFTHRARAASGPTTDPAACGPSTDCSRWHFTRLGAPPLVLGAPHRRVAPHWY